MATTPLHLVPPTYTGAQQSLSPQESSSAASIAGYSTAQILLERSDIDKSLKSLENVLSLLYDYAQLWQSVVSLDKKLVKAFKEAGGMKRTGSPDGVEWPNNVINTSAHIFDSVNEVDGKYSKLVEREYESCNQELKKWIKKLKKEDKSLDEYTSAANAKIKAAGQAYEKKSKKGITSSPSGPSLDSYSALLSTLSSSVANAKHQHTLFVSTRHLSTLYVFSGSIGRIADAQWMKTAELLRRASPLVGPLGEGRSYVEGGWKGGSVVELPLNLPMEESGEGTIKAIPRDTTSASTNLPISSPIPNTPAFDQRSVRAPVPPTPASEAPTKGSVSSSTDMLERIARELQGSMALPSTPLVNNKADGVTTKEAARAPEAKPPPTEPKPPVSAPKEKEIEKPAKPKEPSPAPAPVVTPEAPITSSTGTTNTTRSGATIDSTSTSNTSAKDSSSSEPKNPNSTPKPDPKPSASTATKPPRIPTPPPLSHNLSGNEPALFEPSHTLARTPITLATEKKEEKNVSPVVQDSPNTSMSPRSPGPGSYFPSARPLQDNGVVRPIPRSNTSQAPAQSPPPPAMPQVQIPGAYPQTSGGYGGKPVGRTMSIDSTTSNGSLVAAMRDRYSAASPPPSQPPIAGSGRREPPQGWRSDSFRDRGEGPRPDSFVRERERPDSFLRERDREREFIREREGGKVSDMASRFTPIEGPLPTSATYNNSTFVAGGEGRYPHPNSRLPYLSSPQPGGRGPERMERDNLGRDELPIRTPLKRSSMDEFGASFAGVGSGRRGMETMPNPERRPGVSTPLSSHPPLGPGPNSAGNYDLHLSELELQTREMELEVHRQRLQLAKEREAIIRERGYGGGNNSDYGSVREDRGYRRGGNEDAYGGYGSGREKDDGYGRPYPAPAPASYNNNWDYEGPSYPQPQIGTSRSTDRSFPRHEGGQDFSSGLGVLGLGLPPGAAPRSVTPGTPSIAASRSRESLPLSTSMTGAGRSSVDLSSSHGQGQGQGVEDRRPRGAEPRRSADAVNSGVNRGVGKEKEKDKGGTWLGKGLKRLSMPLGAGSSSGTSA